MVDHDFNNHKETINTGLNLIESSMSMIANEWSSIEDFYKNQIRKRNERIEELRDENRYLKSQLDRVNIGGSGGC